MAEQLALIQAGEPAAASGPEPRLPAKAILFDRAARSAAPLVLLHVVLLGDQATVTRRDCGCALERLGWSVHVSEIRSFEKLSTAGMTFLDTDIVPILVQSTLPGHFGGGPTDFQLEEAEDAAGQSVLKLRVHPRLGPLDDARVVEAFLDALGAGSDASQVMVLQWREAGIPRIERRPPAAPPPGERSSTSTCAPGARGVRPPFLDISGCSRRLFRVQLYRNGGLTPSGSGGVAAFAGLLGAR